MSIGDSSAVAAIKAKLKLSDIVRRYAELRQAGSRWVAPCPFHQESKPSFSVNDEEGFYYCFGCQAAGDIFDFYGRVNGLDFRQALAQLSEEAGVELPRSYKESCTQTMDKDFKNRSLQAYRLAAGHFQANLAKDAGRDCRNYLARRGVSDEIAQRFNLGFSAADWHDLEKFLKNNGMDSEVALKAGLLIRSTSGKIYDRFRGRLIFPIENLASKVIAFGGRAINPEDEPKYINSADSPIYKKGQHLFALDLARSSITKSRRALLTEGYMDVLTLHQFGYTEACGVLGTSLTTEQASRLAGFCSRVDLLFDGDDAGRKAALRNSEMLLMHGLQCRVVSMPDGEDIDSLLRGQGRDFVDALLENAKDALAYCLETVSRWSPRDMTAWAIIFLSRLTEPALAAYYLPRLASGLGLSENDLRDSLKREQKEGPAKTAERAATDKGRNLSRQNEETEISRLRQERALIKFVIRNPSKLATLKEKGAGQCLSNPFTAKIWRALEEHGFEQAFVALDEAGKRFWVEACMIGEKSSEEELADILRWLERVLTKNDQVAYMEKLRRSNSSNEFDKEALKAIQEDARRKHGQR